jgi:hypothetical protein
MGIVDDGEDEVDVAVVLTDRVEEKRVERREKFPTRSVIAIVLSKYLQPVFWVVILMAMTKRYGRRFLDALFK